jgi:hypothetical protein
MCFQFNFWNYLMLNYCLKDWSLRPLTSKIKLRLENYLITMKFKFVCYHFQILISLIFLKSTKLSQAMSSLLILEIESELFSSFISSFIILKIVRVFIQVYFFIWILMDFQNYVFFLFSIVWFVGYCNCHF